MKKFKCVLLVVFLFFFCGSANLVNADSVGTQGDLTFVDEKEKNPVENPNLNDNGKSPHSSTSNNTSYLPKTGETNQTIWFIAGYLLVLISIYLLYNKYKKF